MLEKTLFLYKLIGTEKRSLSLRSYADNFRKINICGVVFLKIKNGCTGRTVVEFSFSDASWLAQDLFRCVTLIVGIKIFYDILQTAEKREISEFGTQ